MTKEKNQAITCQNAEIAKTVHKFINSFELEELQAALWKMLSCALLTELMDDVDWRDEVVFNYQEINLFFKELYEFL